MPHKRWRIFTPPHPPHRKNCVCEEAIFDPLLFWVEQLVGHLSEVEDALRGEFSRFGADVGQPVNGVLRFRFVAARIVVKAACNKCVTVRSYFDSWLYRAGADKLRLVPTVVSFMVNATLGSGC
jgi:hypothetical protein